MIRLSVVVLSLFIFTPTILMGQTLIEEHVYDKHNEPIVGANLFIDGTYSGSSSNTDGSFPFIVDEVGRHMLKVRFIGYEEVSMPMSLKNDTLSVRVKMKEAINKIDMITITAGSFEAGGENKRAILNELDIVTTAGATGDIAGILNTLPGTQTV